MRTKIDFQKPFVTSYGRPTCIRLSHGRTIVIPLEFSVERNAGRLARHRPTHCFFAVGGGGGGGGGRIRALAFDRQPHTRSLVSMCAIVRVRAIHSSVSQPLRCADPPFWISIFSDPFLCFFYIIIQYMFIHGK